MFYGVDVAGVHHAGFGEFAHGLAPGLTGLLRGAGIPDGTVVDLGCGSGIFAAALGEAGYDIVGADISPAMIDLARQHAPRGEFHVSPAEDFVLPRCRAVTAPGEVLCYLQTVDEPPGRLPQLFARIHRALDPGGLLVFDVAEIGLDRQRPPLWREGEGWACATRFEYDEHRDQLLRHIVTFTRDGELYRRSDETHRVQLYDGEVVAGWLREAGFAVETVRQYGEFPLLPKRVGFVARKSARG